MIPVELVACTQPRVSDVSAEDFTAYVARIGTVKENPERLLRYLIKHAHWSPFEHTFLTFKIVTSRAIGRELLRHRSFTFQELSQRYEEITEYEEINLRQQSEKNRQSSTNPIDPLVKHPLSNIYVPATEAIKDIQTTLGLFYKELLSAGVARECARFILPESTRTTILMTGSIRSWIHFLAIRDHPNAQWEAQTIARKIKQIFLGEFPTIAAAAFTPPAAPEVTTTEKKTPSVASV